MNGYSPAFHQPLPSFPSQKLIEQFPFQVLLIYHAKGAFLIDKKALNYKTFHKTSGFLKSSHLSSCASGMFFSGKCPTLAEFYAAGLVILVGNKQKKD
jgi:hypothetical protein